MLPFLLRFLRGISSVQSMKGGTRLLMAVLPRYCGRDLIVDNNGMKFHCDMNSFIDRSLAVLGDYERGQKEVFLNFINSKRSGLMLDIGANIGSHSIYFSKFFKKIISFEPNPDIFQKLEKNLQLNPDAPVNPFMIGLGSEQGILQFYQPEDDFPNKGTGTFDKNFAPERFQIIELPVVRGDQFLSGRNLGRVDAIKIDVQGFEVHVLKGLKETIRRDRPVIWLEISDATLGDIALAGGLGALLPEGYQLKRFSVHVRAFVYRHYLQDLASIEPAEPADYLLVPLE